MISRNVPTTSVLFFLLAVISIATIGCGSMNSTSNRVLQSMSLSPANADAQSTQGKVQFTATGTFSKAPSPATVPFVSPYTGTWASSNSNIATITQTGLAQCVGGAAGTVMISAIASTNSATGPQMSTAVHGSANLTCP
jgi:Bacterial Ig-like domain (group 2)